MITKNFIKQCEQAEEIQNEWTQRDWDIFAYRYSKGLGMVWEVIGVKNRSLYIKENCIWLPTQEQLQEMIGKQSVKLDGEISRMANMFFISNNNQMLWNEFWLMYVMHEKWNKIWTGEKWVKADD